MRFLRATYGILLFVMSVVLVVAAGAAAGATRSYLRYDTTASIVMSSERDDTASSRVACNGGYCPAGQKCCDARVGYGRYVDKCGYC